MSALGELLQKHNTSALDRAVISFSIDDQGDGEDGEDAAAELLAIRAELTDWRDTYDITMPCGHKNRYLLHERCLMCEMDDAKERAKLAEANWHKNEVRLNKLRLVTDALAEIVKHDNNNSLSNALLAEYEKLKGSA